MFIYDHPNYLWEKIIEKKGGVTGHPLSEGRIFISQIPS
jgi:hypothetical protein